LRSLDKAVDLIQNKNGIQIDKAKLREVRDRLLSQEMAKFLLDLQSLRGLTLVEGDWTFEKINSSYLFRRSLVDDVTDPPICEIKLEEGSLPPQYREILAEPNSSPIRLSVFGSVITGVSQKSRKLRLGPIAVY